MREMANNKERPLAVVISALIRDDGKILLIKRAKGDYAGLWGLPGGKIEKEEHLSEAAVREIREESGIDSAFVSFFGYVSEHLLGPDGKVESHFLLHLCELSPKKNAEARSGKEGELKWFELDKLPEGGIIPSDFLIIEKMVKHRNEESHYYNCVIERTSAGEHVLKKFEPVGSAR